MQTSTSPSAAGAADTSKSFTRFIPAVVRVLMGLGFTIFGLNGFLDFMPKPNKSLPQGAMDFVVSLMKTGYMMKLVAGTQLLAGVLLLVNRFVPLALLLLMPVLVNIIAFHIFLEPAGTVPGAVFMVFELYLAWVYRNSFRSVLAVQARPE